MFGLKRPACFCLGFLLILVCITGCGKREVKTSSPENWDEAPVITIPEDDDTPETDTIPESDVSSETEDKVEELSDDSPDGMDTCSSDEAQSGSEETSCVSENSEGDVMTDGKVEISDTPVNGDTASEDELDWVSSLKVSKQTAQLLIVSANGSAATVSFHRKSQSGIWEEVFSTQGKIGKNGVGKTKEGDHKTPRGIYHFLFAFGALSDPGTALEYRKIGSGDYWVDDSASQFYNQFVNINEVNQDWSGAEHLIDAGASYNYALATDYNASCEKGKGSAIFVHCLPTGGAGCIALPQEKVRELLTQVNQDCIIVIDSQDAIASY